MREHLPTCAACRARYEKHLLLEELDPDAPGAEARIAAGLGLEEPRQAKVYRFAAPALAVLALAAAIFLVVGKPWHAGDGGFTARGADATDQGADVLVYRGATRASELIDRDDELAFAYENSAGKAFLMIFGVDEQRHVYWYYPAWTDPTAEPRSVPIVKTDAPKSLPDAVRQPIEGKSLDIRAVFSDEPLSVKDVEVMVARAPADAAQLVTRAGVIERSVRFRIP
ncbi:MAG TPA: hypothetical protein VIF62_36445 [Labilithrix sp.]